MGKNNLIIYNDGRGYARTSAMRSDKLQQLLVCNLKLSYKYQGSFLQQKKTSVKLSHMLQIRNPGGHFVFSSYFSFLQTSKTSLRSVRLNSPPELGSKKTLHLFIIFFIFANIQNFQKIRLCYIVPQNWGLVEHFCF